MNRQLDSRLAKLEETTGSSLRNWVRAIVDTNADGTLSVDVEGKRYTGAPGEEEAALLKRVRPLAANEAMIVRRIVGHELGAAS